MELIDKAAVVAEIEKLLKRYSECQTRNIYEEGLKEGRLIGYKDALHKLEAIEAKEVDLKKEVELWMQGKPSVNFEWGNVADAMRDCAEHFFKLGLMCKSSYIDIPNIDDTLKEIGVDPDSKVANSIEHRYYDALEKFKEKKVI